MSECSVHEREVDQAMVSTAAWVGYGFGAAAFLLVVADIVRRLRLPRRSFRGKHVLITGGSQGIGKALGKALVARGARVSLLARTEAIEARTEARARRWSILSMRICVHSTHY